MLSNADDDYLFPLIESVGWEFQAVLSSEMARAYKPLPSPFFAHYRNVGCGARRGPVCWRQFV